MQDDTRLEEGAYRILIQGKTVGRDRVRREGWLVVAPEHDLESLKGERCEDPTYGMPAVWMEERPDPEIYSLCFDPVSVICTHLTERIKAHAAELLGVDEVEALLSGLGRPTLVKLVTERFSVVLLRRVLKNLLRERLTIRPLPLILETLLDCPEGAGEETLTERARAALGWFTCQELANPQGEINAIVFEPGYQREILNAWEKESSAIFKKVQRVVLEVHADGRNAVIVVDPDLRPGLAKKLRDPNVSVLSTEEIDPAFRVLPWRVLERVED